MTRITKTLITHLVESILEPKRLEIEKLEKNLKIKLQSEVMKRIPASVISFYLKNPNYVSTSKVVQLFGNKWTGQILYLYEELPSKKGRRILFKPTANVAEELFKRNAELLLVQRMYANEKKEILSKINCFKSIEKLVEGFPRVIPHLPIPLIKK